MQGLEDAVYAEVTKALMGALTQLPEANRHAGVGFSATDFDKLLNIMPNIGNLTDNLDGFSFETTLNSVVCTFANVGLCFEINNFSMFSDLSKIVLSIGMLLGRLEIFPLLTLFVDFKRR